MLRESRHGAMTPARREELDEELPEIAKHTSEMERRADEAERELLQWKKVRFMADKVGDEYEGYITGVAPFGLFIELIEHYVEGLVHVSSMADDYYRFVEQQHMLHGENTKKVYRLGDKVRRAGRPRGHGAPAGRSRAGGDSGAGAAGRARAGTAASSVRSETERSGERRKAQRPGGASGRRGRAATAVAAGVARTSRSSGGLRAVLRRVLEIPDAPADAPADLGQAVGAEDQDDDRQDDDQLRNAKVHMSPSAPIVPRMIRGIIADRGPGGRWLPDGADTGLFAQFSSGVQLIEVYATVTDAKGELVTGLRQSDFQVFENDRPQEISAFAAGEFPLTVALGVDRSFSMAGEPLRLAKLASQTFLRQLKPGDRSMVVAIGNNAEVIAPLSSDRAAQAQAIAALDAWSTTALNDAVIVALDRLEPEKGRQALVVFSDGADRYSQATSGQVIARARRSQALVYPITIGQDARAGRGRTGDTDRRPIVPVTRSEGARTNVVNDRARACGIST